MDLRLIFCAWVWVCFQFAFYFCSFLPNCTTPFSGWQPGAWRWRDEEGATAADPSAPSPGPSLTQAPGGCEWVCVGVCMLCSCARGREGEGGVRADACEGCHRRVRGDGHSCRVRVRV